MRLKVSFESHGSLIQDFERFERSRLERPEHKDDPDIFGNSATSRVSLIVATTTAEPLVFNQGRPNTSRLGKLSDIPTAKPARFERLSSTAATIVDTGISGDPYTLPKVAVVSGT